MAVFKTSCEIPENLPISFPAYHHSTEGESPIWLQGGSSRLSCLETTSPSLPTQVIFWCLNEEMDFEAAYSLGATGVITDYPTALRHYLDNHEAAA